LQRQVIRGCNHRDIVFLGQTNYPRFTLIAKKSHRGSWKDASIRHQSAGLKAFEAAASFTALFEYDLARNAV
jgi:hypothetical protein